MSVHINKILRPDPSGQSFVCQLSHEGHAFQASIIIEKASDLHEGQDYSFEMAYKSIRGLEILSPYTDDLSGLFANQADPSLTDIVGRVHELIDSAEGAGYDVYLQNGPEFIYLAPEQVHELTLEVGDGVRFTALGLTLYLAA